MSKFIARLFFILIPAIAIGLLFSMFHWFFGLMFFIVMTCVGIEVTKLHSERGEG